MTQAEEGGAVEPRANQKQKTVNFTAMVTVNGKKETIAKEQASYARLVSVQASLAGVVVGLVSMGTGRIADAVDGLPDEKPGGGERLSLSYQIDQKIWEEGHSVPLYQRPELIFTKSTLENFGAFGFANKIYENIGFKK